MTLLLYTFVFGRNDIYYILIFCQFLQVIVTKVGDLSENF